MAIKYIIILFVETPRKFITAKLSIRKPGSSSVLIICDLFNSHALFFFFLISQESTRSTQNFSETCPTLSSKSRRYSKYIQYIILYDTYSPLNPMHKKRKTVTKVASVSSYLQKKKGREKKGV
jgi:hypothetical protein